MSDEPIMEEQPEVATPFVEETDPGTEIRDTDIVFDCPHCGHNLAIDYRGAGLQINCVNCGELVLVPIPDGMKIDDLDIEPGEILKQLFAARRNLQKSEKRAEDLASELDAMTNRASMLEGLLKAAKMQLNDLEKLFRQQEKLQAKAQEMLDELVLEANSEEDGVVASVAGESGESEA